MRIQRIHIEGYGIFRDFSLDDLSPETTVIVGPNESGKTTLLSFIRTILFGFLDRRSAENSYEPLRGGRHGGRIFLTDSHNETYVVERFAGPRGGILTLTLPGGARGTDRDMAALLRPASRDLFRYVFAFSLAELQTFETLSSDEVRTLIYVAGLGIGRLGLPEIEKKIQQEREKLFKESGSAQTIARLIREAEQARIRLHQLSTLVEEHDQLRAHLENLHRRMEVKQEERRTMQARASHTSNLIKAWDDWTELKAAQERLGELPQVDHFPADGITRLERHLQEQKDLEEQIRQLRNELAGARKELDGLQVDERILAQFGEVERLKRGLDRYESARDDLPQRQAELEAARRDLQGSLRDLGPDWGEARVETFNTSLSARETVREHRAQLTLADTQLHDAESEAKQARERLGDARSRFSRLALPSWPMVVAVPAVGAIAGWRALQGDLVGGIVIAVIGLAVGFGYAWLGKNLRKEALQEVERLESRVREAEDQMSQARTQIEGAREAWGGWLNGRGIDAAMTPETCLELLSRVESAREKIKSIDSLRDRIAAIEKAMAEFEGRANDVRRACGWGKKERAAFPGAVDELIEAATVAKQNSERVATLRQKIKDASAKEAVLKGRGEKAEETISKLLAEAEASDEEDFRQRAQIFAKREELKRTVRERRKNLERIAGSGQAVEKFMRELETAAPEQLQQAEQEANERLSEIETELQAMEQERGQIRERIRQLETEEESSELRLRLSVLQEQIRSEAQKWSVLTLAKALLEETRLKYERERQPAVIQEAQTFFRSFTDGRYERIFSLPGENRIEVEERAGSRKEIADLSRGTAEQLYLALRFGLVREFARRAKPLPVIMDDILVNFDPDRARQACRALGELSRDQQVLLFTCHPETVDLMRSEVQDCKVIPLQMQLG